VRDAKDVFLWLLAALIIVLAAVRLAGGASAHSFYPWECCSDQDCWPMGDRPGDREPEPTFTAAGWRLHDGAVVPFAAARPSPDGRFHVCRRAGQAEGQVIRPEGRPICLWAPMGAS
jgi:hypothetical protein